MSSHKSKKRKKSSHTSSDIDTSKPTAIFKPSKGRKHTLSVALPGSIVANAQSHDLKTSLIGHVARALAVFCVDEVIVFNDGQGSTGSYQDGFSEDSYTGQSDPNHFMSHLFSYLETPPHLRKHLFPLHPNLRTAGTLPSLDMPHHLRANEWSEFREGVAVPAPNPNPNALPRQGKRKAKAEQESEELSAHIDVGLMKPVILDTPIPLYSRVTVRLPDKAPPSLQDKVLLNGKAVAPSFPREQAGYYWGFNVRSANSLSAVLTECPFDGGYDVTVGTSERGQSFSELEASVEFKMMIEKFDHLLLLFGGVAGLEVAVSSDEELAKLRLKSPAELFDSWLNLCPSQGSRTIRTEEAVWLGLMCLSGHVAKRGS